MDKEPATEEQPKKTIAKKLITPKRKYFVPTHGMIEATNLADVEKQLSKKEKDEKVGDAR
jgi:hypothetical protein